MSAIVAQVAAIHSMIIALWAWIMQLAVHLTNAHPLGAALTVLALIAVLAAAAAIPVPGTRNQEDPS